MNGIDLYDGITLHQGDCRDIMRSLPADHFDAVITDPPYGISFAGEKWDTATPHGFQARAQSWGAAALRVIKPGGYLLAFSAPRTYHRLTSGLDHVWPVFRYQPKAPSRERPIVGGYSTSP